MQDDIGQMIWHWVESATLIINSNAGLRNRLAKRLQHALSKEIAPKARPISLIKRAKSLDRKCIGQHKLVENVYEMDCDYYYKQGKKNDEIGSLDLGLVDFGAHGVLKSRLAGLHPFFKRRRLVLIAFFVGFGKISRKYAVVTLESIFYWIICCRNLGERL